VYQPVKTGDKRLEILPQAHRALANEAGGLRNAPSRLASYPPTVPAVRPRTKYRCSETNTSTGTAMVMIAPPVTTCQP
jgi:hypothetical protein